MRKLILCCIVMWTVPALAGPFKVSSPNPSTAMAIKFGAEWEGGVAQDTLTLPKLELKLPVSPRVDFSVELPYQSIRPSGQAMESGISDVEFKSKWNFYRAANLALAIEPKLAWPVGTFPRSSGSRHAALELPLIFGYKAGSWTLGSELGYKHKFKAGGDSVYWGLLAMRSVLQGLRIGAEIVVDSPRATMHDLGTRANVGLKWRFGRGFELEALAGHTLHAPAGGSASLFKLSLERKF